MRLRHLLSSLVLASAFALTAAPPPAEAMQNIKCIAADRALLKEWTEIATTALKQTDAAPSSLKQGRSADLSAVRQSYGKLLEIDPKRFATPELREQMEKVHQRLEAVRTTLREAKGERAVPPLEEAKTLLAEHTAPAKGWAFPGARA